MDYEKFAKLRGKEDGERVDIKQAYKWVLEDMDYDDFRKLTTLCFSNRRAGGVYNFRYLYMREKKHDSKKARQDYLKYYFYKLIQNIYTEGIDLQ